MNQEQNKPTDIQILKTRAVRQAMIEVIAEQRAEIIKRAAAKLAAMGVTISPDELEMPTPG